MYIAAFAPDAGETSQGQIDKFPKAAVLQHVQVANGRVWLTPDGVADFAGDLSQPEQKLVYATQYPLDAALFSTNAPGVAWKTKPSWYIVASKDQTINPDYERFAAKRMKAHVTEVDSSHVVMLSKPEAVVEVVLKAAQGVQHQAA